MAGGRDHPDYGPPLGGEGYVDGLYSYLWTRDSSANPCPHVALPHTVVYKHGAIAQWFFTASDGVLQRRRKTYLKNPDVIEVLGAEGKHQPDKVIVQCLTPRAAGRVGAKPQGMAACLEYWNYQQLEHFLQSEPKPREAILQAFVPPAGRQNLMLRALWSRSMLYLEQMDNRHGLTDTYVTMFERCCTFDGPPHLTNPVASRDPVLLQRVQRQLQAVGQHIEHVTAGQAQIARMVVFLKPGADGRLWLLFSDSLSLRAESGLPRAMSIRQGRLKCQRCEAGGQLELKELPLKKFVPPDSTSMPPIVQRNFRKIKTEDFSRLQNNAVFLSIPVHVCLKCYTELEGLDGPQASTECFYNPHGSATRRTTGPISEWSSRHSRISSKLHKSRKSHISEKNQEKPWLEMPGIKMTRRPSKLYLRRMPNQVSNARTGQG